MVEVKTDDGEQLTLTLTHILFYYEDDKPTSTYAKDLRPGSVLVGGSGEVCLDLSRANVVLINFFMQCLSKSRLKSAISVCF